VYFSVLFNLFISALVQRDSLGKRLLSRYVLCQRFCSSVTLQRSDWRVIIV